MALESAPMEAKDGAQSWEKDLNTRKAPCTVTESRLNTPLMQPFMYFSATLILRYNILLRNILWCVNAT